MISERILSLAQQVVPRVIPTDITLLDGGFSSQAFRVNANEPFVLLVHRDHGVTKPTYDHAYVILELLARRGYNYAPRALWLAPDHEAIALSAFDGQAANQFDFEAASVDRQQLALNVIDRLIDVTEISISEYQAMARTLNITPLPPKTALDSAKLYGTDWLKVVEVDCPDKAITEWLQINVPRSVAMAHKMADGPLQLSHGDPSNPNILIRPDGQWLLIDWDSSRFVNKAVPFIISYTTLLTDFMQPFEQVITQHVSQRLKMAEEQLHNDVLEFRKFNQVFDVNWAAMMMAKVTQGQAEGTVEEYRKIALERISIYENLFGKG